MATTIPKQKVRIKKLDFPDEKKNNKKTQTTIPLYNVSEGLPS